MSESLLNKTFSEKDLQRARNIITGNSGTSTQTVVGYEKIEVEHKEGDVWEENGKTWTIEDGVKVSVSKIQRARDLVKMPLVCPKCGKPMSTRYDKKMYPIHGMCFDCVTKMEDELRRAGLYKQYEKEMMDGNIKGFVRDMKARIEDMKSDLDVTTVTGEGEQESWGRLSTQMIDHLEEWASILLEKTL